MGRRRKGLGVDRSRDKGRLDDARLVLFAGRRLHGFAAAPTRRLESAPAISRNSGARKAHATRTKTIANMIMAARPGRAERNPPAPMSGLSHRATAHPPSDAAAAAASVRAADGTS